MSSKQIRILLAEDDLDDCFLFKEALYELCVPICFTIVNDGEQLMKHLNLLSTLPHILFLDVNMPRKNGFECLKEIKCSEKLKVIPVILFSTSYDQKIVEMAFDKGAQYYIRKPGEFEKLKQAVHHVLSMIVEGKFIQPDKENCTLDNFKFK